jgi:hypothetical protein
MDKLQWILVGGRWDSHAGEIKQYALIEVDLESNYLSKSNIVCSYFKWTRTNPDEMLKYSKYTEEIDNGKVYLLKDVKYGYVDKLGVHFFDEKMQSIIENSIKDLVMEECILLF